MTTISTTKRNQQQEYLVTEWVQRATHQGINSLSDGELFALILSQPEKRHSVSAQKREQTLRETMQFITERGGISEVANSDLLLFAYREEEQSVYFAWQVRALVELSRRLNRAPMRTQIRSTNDIIALVGPEMRHLTHEEMRILLLTSKNDVVENVLLYRGTVDSCSVRIAEILRPAVLRQCPRFVLLHNHPSGDTTPSPEDKLVTREVIKACHLLTIELLDHIIIGNPKSLSLKDSQSELWR